MSIIEQFIPGRWVDDIDVNDFIKLNKKPFLSDPIFLKSPTFNTHPINLYKLLSEEKVVELNFSSFSNPDANWFPVSVESEVMKRKIGYSENLTDIKNFYPTNQDSERETSRKTTHEVYQEIATSDMNKAFRIGLFQHHPYNYTPMFVFPDIRTVPLYGTKELLKEKRYYLTRLERYLQTSDWIQLRISKQKEIEAIKQFEKFAKSLGVNVSLPATSTKKAIDMLYVTFLSIVIENPSIGFSLTDIITFVDVYAEKELQLGLITEEEIQTMIDEFFQKISKVRFTFSPQFANFFETYPFILGEMLGETVTKTTYRFLSAVERFYEAPFVLRVIWGDHLPNHFKQYVLSLFHKGIPFSFVSTRVLQELKNPLLLPFGMHGESFDEIIFHGGGCDLEKALYLAVNGGKEIESNTNLSAITSPLRQNQISYEEVKEKFLDFLSFVILSYVEFMNAIMYINDIHHNHPLRSSLITNQPFYSISFGFFHLKKIVNILAALQKQEAEIVRKQQKYISSFIPKEKKYETEDMIMTDLISFIKKELKKIPMYKEARHSVRFYESTMYEVLEANGINFELTLPPEYIKGNFHANIVHPELTEEFIRHCFSRNITELNVSKNSDFFLANGLLFHNLYRLKKEQ